MLLRRRLVPSRPIKAAGDGAVEKLMRVEFPRSADQLIGLRIDVQTVSFQGVDQTGILRTLDETHMICLIARKGGETGLMTLDASLLSGLIEVQTLGRVKTAVAPDRVPTRTDVVMVSDMLDRWLTDISEAASRAGLADALPFFGYGREPGILGLRAVELTLDPGTYRSVRLQIALEGGARIGTLSYFLPAIGKAHRGQNSVDTLGARLRPHLWDARVELSVILDRIRHPLGQALHLQPGDILDIAPGLLNRVRLEARSGVSLAIGRLGQLGGHRAVCLSGEDDIDGAGGVPLSALPRLARPVDADIQLPEEHIDHMSMDLPDLPDLSDLPELPELPDLD